MALHPYERSLLEIALKANGWISHSDLTLRLKNVVFPSSARTAGVVAAAEVFIGKLVSKELLERRQVELVRTYTLTKKGREVLSGA